MSNLRRHERVHTRDGPYECKQCGRCFSVAGSLKSHERVHTGEKPYECKQCGKCFSEVGNMRRHERVHTGEKPYECKHCGKCFSEAEHLRRHQRVHLNAKLSKLPGYKCKRTSSQIADNRSLNPSRSNNFPSQVSLHRNSSLIYPSARESKFKSKQVIIAKYSCWICQEEMCSEALLLQHYEDHMKDVCEETS